MHPESIEALAAYATRGHASLDPLATLVVHHPTLNEHQKRLMLTCWIHPMALLFSARTVQKILLVCIHVTIGLIHAAIVSVQAAKKWLEEERGIHTASLTSCLTGLAAMLHMLTQVQAIQTVRDWSHVTA